MANIFEEVIGQHSLLEHPFYIAWREGRLGRGQLALYSCEWGTFIRQASKGWRAAREQQVAEEELAHFRLWERFADSVCPQIIAAKLRPSVELLQIAEGHFNRYPSALGALYAFEAQQPLTAKSKLDGIREHYSHWRLDTAYFEAHINDWREPALLEEKINALSAEDRQMALSACAWTCKALWDALTGIMEAKTS